MEYTQSYAYSSSANIASDGLHMDVASELSRPPVSLDAMVRDSLSYARLMLSLYDIVSGDYRAKKKDHSAYQEWVQHKYLEELPAAKAARFRQLPELYKQRDIYDVKKRELYKDIRLLEGNLASKDYYTAQRKYFQWLLIHDRAAWFALDPVVSVHPDCVVFEVFSIDESSYGRVTVPMDKLECYKDTVYGTTNVDYSRALADEFCRVRNYRPAFLKIGGGDVAVGTDAGRRVEKKIDLPPTWVRGFLQVQSAAAFPSVDLTLSATALSEILAVLRSQREDRGPRSLRFQLTPGELPSIIVEPWGIVIKEISHRYEGVHNGDIRIWGRRRLLALESSLPFADDVKVRLLGTGMPSYWTVQLDDHRLDLGISGWTKNDWSQAARFDLLSSTGAVDRSDMDKAASILEERLALTPDLLAELSDLTREASTVALQRLCREGRAMYDLASGVYRWRKLLPFPVEIEEEDPRVHLAKRLVATGGVKWLKAGEDEFSFGLANLKENVTRYRAQVRGGEDKRERKFQVVLDMDADGRALYAQCNCAWHRREKLRKGPCAHILAATVLASQQNSGAAVQAPSSAAKGSVLNPDRFKGQTIVFTGALSIFTREQAEALVHQGGERHREVSVRIRPYWSSGKKRVRN